MTQTPGGPTAAREILTEIGEGGFGTTYVTADPATGRAFVVKLGRDAPHGGIPARWTHLYPRLVALGEHPAMVSIIDGGRSGGGRPYLVMERLTGGSLEARLAQAPVETLHAVSIAVRLAGALEATHRMGLVHGDLKPANVLLDARGAAVLTDASIGSLSAGRTSPVGTYLASVQHLAPEVLSGGTLSAAADQYALASLIHTMVTGQPVFPLEPGESLREYAHRVRATPIPPLATLGWPAELGLVLDRMLAKNPAQRFPSMQVAAQALQAFEHSERGVVTPLNVRAGRAPAEEAAELVARRRAEQRPEPDIDLRESAAPPPPRATDAVPAAPPRRSKRRRRVLAAVGTVGVAAAGLVAGSLLLDDSDEPPTEVLDDTEVNTSTTTTTTEAPATTTTEAPPVTPPVLTLPPDFVPIVPGEEPG